MMRSCIQRVGNLSRSLTFRQLTRSFSTHDGKDQNLVDEIDVEEYFDKTLPKFEEKDPKERFREEVPIPLTRGKRGVFDVDEMVTLLRHEGVFDICALQIPREARYVEHMIIGSCHTQRQSYGVAEVVRKVYKLKRAKVDIVPEATFKKEPKNEWIGMDLGNIVLHLFLPSIREYYDLESLWACGHEFDTHLNRSAGREEKRDVFDWRKLAEELKSLK